MDDLKDRLREALGGFRPAPDALDRTRSKLVRHRRSRRLGAGLLSAAVAIAGTGLAIRAFDHMGSGISPSPTSSVSFNTLPVSPTVSNGDIWARVGGGDGPSFVFSVDPSTGRATALFNDGTGHDLPGKADPSAVGEQYTWSPSGSRVAFSDYSGHGAEIFALAPDGGSLTKITHDGGLDTFPAWSPDGEHIAYASDTSPPTGPDAPYYTPGCEYSFTDCPSHIAVIGIDGSGERTLASNMPGTMPSWSPDGSKIAFVSNLHDPSGGIFTMNADGSDVTRITSGPAYDLLPAWSPDGSKIAFVREQGSTAGIYVMNPDGSEVQLLAAVPGGNTPNFAWSPDGRLIAYGTGSRQTSLHLVNVGSSTTSAVKVSGLPHGYAGFGDPSWRPVPTNKGTIAGHLYVAGGPVRSVRAVGGTVVITGAGGDLVHVTVQVRSSGVFAARVPPGTYSVVGHAPSYMSGKGVCQGGSRVKVGVGTFVVVDVGCQEK
jgi:dipeptidyl aminopeptidase/acylaminoacyl peptidase